MSRTFSLLGALRPDQKPQAILTAWDWLLRSNGKQYGHSLVTLFGDWFLEAATGEIHFLDMLEGQLQTVASSKAEFIQLLRDPSRGRELLMADMAEVLWTRGMRPGPGQCFGFRVPPFLGGAVTSENVQVYELNVYVTIQGELQRQARDGRPVNYIKVE